MKEYILRIQGDMADLEPCDQCSDIDDLEAIMVAMIKSLREKIDVLEGRIKELEKRPIVTAEPIKQLPNVNCPGEYLGWRLDPPFVFTCRP